MYHLCNVTKLHSVRAVYFCVSKDLTTTAVVSLNCYNRLVVFIETDCAYREIDTKSLHFI